MKVIARYSGFKVVDIPNNLSLTEDDIMDYLYGLDVQCDDVDYEVLEEETGECPHWSGIFCKLDFVKKEWAPHISSENEIKRNCHKCVYEVGCTDNPVGCKRYKRDAPDGGYYG